LQGRAATENAENLTQRRKVAKVKGVAATDVAKAMSVKKERKERKKRTVQ
jgi:hypothetical protein